MDGAYEQQAPDDRAAVGDTRNAGIVLGAAVSAMGLLAGLFYGSSIAVCRP